MNAKSINLNTNGHQLLVDVVQVVVRSYHVQRGETEHTPSV